MYWPVFALILTLYQFTEVGSEEGIGQEIPESDDTYILFEYAGAATNFPSELIETPYQLIVDPDNRNTQVTPKSVETYTPLDNNVAAMYCPEVLTETDHQFVPVSDDGMAHVAP